ncbi:MAG: HPr family phosphocarrier protein [Angelakisella sp.]|jgi:phosphocarrier,  HPr family|uniref:HPr family phosphocarrier protein n=1 Tax=Angelakisella sp. TaxID=1935177 RepID=UPI003A216C73|nr:HPr family phosphocarrier protein [Angelakisella sp.]
MYQRKTTIINRTGIHARPASVFVNEAKKFQSNITICNLSLNEQNNTANAKSIIKVLTLALSQGSEVEVSAEGVDEKEAVDVLIELIDSGFGET